MSPGPPPFPDVPPAGYAPLADAPTFDAARHLALEGPKLAWTLASLGYDARTIAANPSKIAVAGPFRVLSDEGVAAAREVARRLQPLAIDSSRTARYVTGALYRSRFLRDLFAAPELTAFVSEIAGADLVPHAMPALGLYINYAPSDVGRHVDPWHTDSIGFDVVLMLTDPAELRGGAFQFLRGTIDEAARHFGTTADRLIDGGHTELPPEQVESVTFPGPGWGLFQQGNLVVHRAERLLQPGERITMVPGYVARDASYPDPTNAPEIVGWREPGLYAELARHKAWLTVDRLERLIGALPIDAGPGEAAAALDAAIADARDLVELLARADVEAVE